MADNTIDDNIVKSVIYGNQVQNRYGKFRAFCSAISAQEQIEKMVSYLREKESFKKYNKIVYSYRLFHKPTFFVTQDEQQQQPEGKFIEGYEEDPTIEGSGQKLLHLLQKFNVENVLIAVGIEQYDPLAKFEPVNFKIIVERAKDLLNNLYSRVIQSELEQKNGQNKQNGINVNTRKEQRKVNVQDFQFPLIEQNLEKPKFQTKEQQEMNRPNHIFQNGKPNFLRQQPTNNYQSEDMIRRKKMNDLTEKLKEQAYSLEKILTSMVARDYLQLRFVIEYDQNKLTEKILKMLMIITGIPQRERLIYEYNLQEGLKNMTVNDLDDQKVKKINDMLRGDKRLTIDTISNFNQALSPLFAFIKILVKSYENGKMLAQLEDEEFGTIQMDQIGQQQNSLQNYPQQYSQQENYHQQSQQSDYGYKQTIDRSEKRLTQNSRKKTQPDDPMQDFTVHSNKILIKQKNQGREQDKLPPIQNNTNLMQDNNQIQTNIKEEYSEENLKNKSESEKLTILQQLNIEYIEKANSHEYHQGYWDTIGYKSQGKTGPNNRPPVEFIGGFLESSYGDDVEFYNLQEGTNFHCFENDMENYKPCMLCSKVLDQYIMIRKRLKLAIDL